MNRETDLGPQCFGNLDFINARSRRILSIDFSPNKRNVIVTGSADSVVRVIEIDKNPNNDAADVIFQVSLGVFNLCHVFISFMIHQDSFQAKFCGENQTFFYL